MNRSHLVLLIVAMLLLPACQVIEHLPSSLSESADSGRGGGASTQGLSRPVSLVREGDVATGGQGALVLDTLDFNQAVALGLRHSLARGVRLLREVSSDSDISRDASELPALAAYPRYQREFADPVDASASGLQATLEQQRILAEAWDVLDVALATRSLRELDGESQQNHYLRRRAVQNITRQIRQFYWQSWIWQDQGERIRGQRRELEQRVETLVGEDRQGERGARARLQSATAVLSRLQGLEHELLEGQRGLRRLVGPVLDVPVPLKDPRSMDPVNYSPELSRLNFDKVALLSRPELRTHGGVVRIARAKTVAQLILANPPLSDWLSGGVEKDAHVSSYQLLRAATVLADSLLKDVDATRQEVGQKSADQALVKQAVVMQLRLAQQGYELVRRYARSLHEHHKSMLVDGAAGPGQVVNTPGAQNDLHTAYTLLEQVDGWLVRVAVRNAEARLGNSISDDVLLNADMQAGLDDSAEIVRMYMHKSVLGAYRSSVRSLRTAEPPVLRALQSMSERSPAAAGSAVAPAAVARLEKQQARGSQMAALDSEALMAERIAATRMLHKVDPEGHFFTLLIGRQGGKDAAHRVAQWLSQPGVAAYRNRLFVYKASGAEIAVAYGVFEDAISAINATRTDELKHLSDHANLQVVQISILPGGGGAGGNSDAGSSSKASFSGRELIERGKTVASQSSGASYILQQRMRATREWFTDKQGRRGYVIQLAYRSGPGRYRDVSELLASKPVRTFLEHIHVYKSRAYGKSALIVMSGFYPGYSLAQKDLQDRVGELFSDLGPLQIRRFSAVEREFLR